MNFLGLHSIDELLKIDMQKEIINYVVSLRQNKLSHNTIHFLLASIYHFCEMSDIVINKKRIRKYKGERLRVVKDRAYTHDEISKLLNLSNIRLKVVVLLMASSGTRVGAINNLKIKHLHKIADDIYKITIYENSADEYFSFCSSECSKAIETYLEYRKRNGEILTPESYLIVKQFNINDLKQVKNSNKPISLPTLRGLIDSTAIRAGLRSVNRNKVRRERKEVALTHAFRKFFTGQLVNSKVNPEIREMLLGHSIGLASSYYKPTDEEMLNEYLKAVDSLTIDPSNRLKREVKFLQSRQDEIEMMKLVHRKEIEKMYKEFEPLLELKNTLIREGILEVS
jgi:integrase